MQAYSERKQQLILFGADNEAIAYSDAAGIVQAHDFYVQQAWGKGLTAEQAAEQIMAKANKVL